MTTFNFNTKLLTLRGKYLSTWIEQNPICISKGLHYQTKLYLMFLKCIYSRTYLPQVYLLMYIPSSSVFTYVHNFIKLI